MRYARAIAMAVAVGALAFGAAAAHPGHGGRSPMGYPGMPMGHGPYMHMGPGTMMGPGMHMGPGMMGRGMMGPGMMMGPGGHMQGTRPGMMGPGMMMGPGGHLQGMGPGRGWHWHGDEDRDDVTADNVRQYLERSLAWQRLKRLKVGKVETKKDRFVADIVTREGSRLVQRYEIDRRSGRIINID